MYTGLSYSPDIFYLVSLPYFTYLPSHQSKLTHNPPSTPQDSNNHTCVDVDECSIVDDVCGAGTCHNTPGAFTCLCLPGHTPDPLSKVCVGELPAVQN